MEIFAKPNSPRAKIAHPSSTLLGQLRLVSVKATSSGPSSTPASLYSGKRPPRFALRGCTGARTLLLALGAQGNPSESFPSPASEEPPSVGVGVAAQTLWRYNSSQRDFPCVLSVCLGAGFLPPASAVATGKCNPRHYKARLRAPLSGLSYCSAKPAKPPTRGRSIPLSRFGVVNRKLSRPRSHPRLVPAPKTPARLFRWDDIRYAPCSTRRVHCLRSHHTPNRRRC